MMQRPTPDRGDTGTVFAGRASSVRLGEARIPAVCVLEILEIEGESAQNRAAPRGASTKATFPLEGRKRSGANPGNRAAS